MRRALAPILLIVATLALIRWKPAAPPVLDEDSLPREVPPLVASAPGSIEELRARIGQVLEREGVPGAGIAVVDRDGPIWVGGVGVADLETRTPVGADTVFRVASITKSIVALGVMKLVEAGQLDLDRPLRELLPDTFDNPWEDTDPVTLAHVLEHTAGLDDMRPNEVFTADDAMTTGEALSINPRSRVIRWRPGSRMAYSNVGYTLAGRAIEAVTHQPFDVWLRREVLLPLGMPDAEFRRTEVLASRLATGYIDRDRPSPFNAIAHRPAGALLASATDLAKLVQFWLRRGDGFPSIVSRAGLDRIERPGTLPFPALDVSYGLGNFGDVSHPVRGRGHDGGLPGFASSYRYFPEIGRGYVVLLNATHSFRAYVEIQALMSAYLMRGRVVATPASAPAPPDARFYAFAAPRNELFGFIERAVLGWRVAETPEGVRLDALVGPSFDLVTAPDGGYRFPGESGSSFRFAKAPDGTPVMIAAFGYCEAAAWWPARLRCGALWIAMILLQLAPLWAAATLAIANIRRRRVRSLGLLVWPALAGLSLLLLPALFNEAALLQVLGEIHPLTVGVWATTLVYAVAATMSAYSALRSWFGADRPRLLGRLVPTACALAAIGLGLWLDAHGIIGLRTWAW